MWTPALIVRCGLFFRSKWVVVHVQLSIRLGYSAKAKEVHHISRCLPHPSKEPTSDPVRPSHCWRPWTTPPNPCRWRAVLTHPTTNIHLRSLLGKKTLCCHTHRELSFQHILTYSSNVNSVNMKQTFHAHTWSVSSTVNALWTRKCSIQPTHLAQLLCSFCERHCFPGIVLW